MSTVITHEECYQLAATIAQALIDSGLVICPPETDVARLRLALQVVATPQIEAFLSERDIPAYPAVYGVKGR